jgi:hypothetical protein
VNYGCKEIYNIGPRLEMLAKDRSSSLFGCFVSDKEKRFYNVDTRRAAVKATMLKLLVLQSLY